MPSPFPEMDPYLEGYLGSDVHNALANKLRQMLVPLLRPRYTKRLEVYLVEDTAPEGEIGIRLIELDLLHWGTHSYDHPRLPAVSYLITLTRAGTGVVEVWPIALSDPLPMISVPLQALDADVPLAVEAALAAIYDEAAYDLSLDYSQPSPSPALFQVEQQWLRSYLEN